MASPVKDQIQMSTASLQRLLVTRKLCILRRISYQLTRAANSIVVQLAQSLDLNSLHALSRTCRQFRENLLQFHRQLATQTLRCVNEPGQPQTSDRVRGFNFVQNTPVEYFGMVGLSPRKVGACARDMVNECRRCGIPVCRVCPKLTCPARIPELTEF